MLGPFLLGLCIRLVAGSTNGAGSLCTADLTAVASHPGINQAYAAPVPYCEFANERDVVVAQGASIVIRLYHDPSAGRKILGWLLYVTDATGKHVGNFTLIYPNYGTLSGSRGPQCSDTSTITHTRNLAVVDVNATWKMAPNAQDGTYFFQALVLTADADGVSNQKFFLPRCPSVCLATPVSCQTLPKSSLVGAQGYLEIYQQDSAVTPCSSSDVVSPCYSQVCDVSADPNHLVGVCQAIYVSYSWLAGLSGRRCTFGGYNFAIPVPGQGIEVQLSGACADDTDYLSAALTDNLMQLTTASGSTFVRALRKHNCVQLGCKLNPWKCVHRGYYDKPDGTGVEKFNLASAPSKNYFCMLPQPSNGECYCDDACTRLRDCCADFAYTCQASLGANISPG